MAWRTAKKETVSDSGTHEQVSDFIVSIGKKYRFKTFGEGALEVISGGTYGEGFAWSGKGMFIKKDQLNILNIGWYMEDMTQLLKTTNEEVLESRKVLETLANEISAISKVVSPALQSQITEIRSSRMALVSELRQSLTMLQDVRKFFLESDYDKEMARLERFVELCKEIKQLQAEGVFGAVCDAAIRLALQEKKSEGKSS